MKEKGGRKGEGNKNGKKGEKEESRHVESEARRERENKKQIYRLSPSQHLISITRLKERLFLAQELHTHQIMYKQIYEENVRLEEQAKTLSKKLQVVPP